MKKLITMMTMMLCVCTLFAQVPEKFSYQAMVRNASNQLVTNVPVGVRVSILQGGVNGTIVYMETQTAVTNANGLITIQIGGGSLLQGNFANIDWANGPFFLKTETDPSGDSDYSITSVQQMLSVPYALYSKEAGNGFSGDYNDLTGRPTNVSEFANDAGYITTAQCSDIDICALANMVSALQQQVSAMQSTIDSLTDILSSDVFTCGTSTVSDYDGNTYNTVQIGQQCWLKENLRTTHYSDGTAIPAGGSTPSTTSPYYYDYSSSDIALSSRGYLYNWSAAMHGASSGSADPSGEQGICPTGWHLPSDAEWTQLTDYVGRQSQYICDDNSSYIAKALASESGWSGYSGECYPGDQSVTANNATGFSAVPAGNYDGLSFHSAGNCASFWSSSQCYSYSAYNHYLYYNYADMYRYNNGKGCGCSVRCLRDDDVISISQPTVTTSAATDITSTTATLNGIVYNPDNVEITAQGFEWKATVNSTYIHVATANTTMTYKLTGIAANTSYTYRAFVTTAEGTAYGAEVVFTTEEITIPAGDAQPCPSTPTVTDYDGNTYNTVQIGQQCWMKENLRTTHFADGTSISAGGSSISSTTPYYYNYPSSSGIALSSRGYLYNWSAAMHGASSSFANPSGVQGICPTGWHLPSDEEWTQLTDYVSAQIQYVCGSDSANIAKALASTIGWNSYSGWCCPGDQSVITNNATGFSAVPAGACEGSRFFSAGNAAYFWSSTKNGDYNYAWARRMYYSNECVNVYDDDTEYGHSVRCLRD